MQIEFTKGHTLKENRKPYKAGDTAKVSRGIRDRLVESGVAKDVKTTATPPKLPSTDK